MLNFRITQFVISFCILTISMNLSAQIDTEKRSRPPSDGLDEIIEPKPKTPDSYWCLRAGFGLLTNKADYTGQLPNVYTTSGFASTMSFRYSFGYEFGSSIGAFLNGEYDRTGQLLGKGGFTAHLHDIKSVFGTVGYSYPMSDAVSLLGEIGAGYYHAEMSGVPLLGGGSKYIDNIDMNIWLGLKLRWREIPWWYLSIGFKGDYLPISASQTIGVLPNGIEYSDPVLTGRVEFLFGTALSQIENCATKEERAKLEESYYAYEKYASEILHKSYLVYLDNDERLEIETFANSLNVLKEKYDRNQCYYYHDLFMLLQESWISVEKYTRTIRVRLCDEKYYDISRAHVNLVLFGSKTTNCADVKIGRISKNVDISKTVHMETDPVTGKCLLSLGGSYEIQIPADDMFITCKGRCDENMFGEISGNISVRVQTKDTRVGPYLVVTPTETVELQLSRRNTRIRYDSDRKLCVLEIFGTLDIQKIPSSAEVHTDRVITLHEIQGSLFAHGECTLLPEGRRQVENAANQIRDYEKAIPRYRLHIVGHTDISGVGMWFYRNFVSEGPIRVSSSNPPDTKEISWIYNLYLGKCRADAVAEQLRRDLHFKGTITTSSSGQDFPLPGTSENDERNRRTEILFIPTND